MRSRKASSRRIYLVSESHVLPKRGKVYIITAAHNTADNLYSLANHHGMKYWRGFLPDRAPWSKRNRLAFLFSRILSALFNTLRVRSSVEVRCMRSDVKIERPPLLVIDRFVQALWTTKTYDRVFKPARADLVTEWEQAHISGNTKRAWYVKHVLGRWILISHIAAQIPLSMIKLLLKILQSAF
jgi:hypothetical protein